MHIVIERSLEIMNHWSIHRTLEVRLCNTPAPPPTEGQLSALWEALTQYPLPPHLAMSDAGDAWDTFIEGPSSSWQHLIGRVAVELQYAVGQPRFDVRYSNDAKPDPRIALECFEFAVAAAAFNAAALLVNQILSTGVCDVSSVFEIVSDADEQYSLGDATGPIVAAARARGLPVLRLDAQSRVQIGEGIQARRIRKAATDVTGFIAEQTSSDKAYTKQLWSRLGIPVPAGRIVADAEDAVKAAEELGWPVVIKPLDSDFSNGVTLNVVDAQSVRAGYTVARTESESVLVERSLPGAVHRFLIVGGRVVSAVRRDPATVIGDSVRTIRELVDAENRSPRRGPDQRWPLQRLRLEVEELAFLEECGLGPDSIPARGVRVELRREPFLTTGGETHEVLDRVHPETLDAVCDAVRVVGLDVAGVDLIARDISRPLKEQGGGLLELNAQPAICLHLAPFNDSPKPVGEAIIETLFSPGTTGRVPLTIVVGDFDSPDELRPLTRAMSVDGSTAAVSTPRVTKVSNRILVPDSFHPADRLAAMHLHPQTAASCLSVSAASLLSHGLGTDRCRFLVLATCHHESADRSPSDVARLLRNLVAIADECIVNLDDPDWGSLIEPGEQSMILCSANQSHPKLQRHLQSGCMIAVVQGQDVIVKSAEQEFGRRRLSKSVDISPHSWLMVVAAMLIERKPRRRRLQTTRVRGSALLR